MRKTLLSLLIIPLAFACNTVQEGVVLTGMIENLNKELFVIGGPGGSRDTVMLDETGAFTFEISDLEKANSYYMILGNEPVYMWLANGMEMDFYADMNNLKETMGFTGTGADINNYNAAKDGRAYDYNWYKLAENEFMYKVDSVLSLQQGNLNIAEKIDASDPYWSMEEGTVLYSWGNYMENYPLSHPYYAKLEDYKAPESWFDFRDQLGVNNPQYIGSRAFESYVASHARRKASDMTKTILEADSTAEVDRHLLNLKAGVSEIEDEKVRTNYLTETINGAMQYTELSELEDAIKFYKENVTDEESIASVNETFEEWMILAKGSPMIDFIGQDLDGNTISSKDFRGKYLYVDVWATWCGPCKYEIPFLKQLEADYHDRNIVFLSYSMDDDKDAWLKFVPENELGGVQIIGQGGWKSPVCTEYKVRGVPTFMFFSPEGKIISTKMTRPSNQKTRDSFDSYSDL